MLAVCVKDLSATRVPATTVLACEVKDEISWAAIRLFPFIFTVEIAGSNAQSDSDDMLEVVATGIPFRRSSEPPAVVSKAPSRFIPNVVRLLILASSASRKNVDISNASILEAVSVEVTNRLSNVEIAEPPPPRPVRGMPNDA
jgi:hypothetical protein